MTTAVQFTKTSEPIRFDKKLGICFTWFCFSKKEGEEYDDEHGDHMPDDELVLAVDKWMAKPASERDLDSGHVETGRGHVATAVAMTEDIVKAASPPIDTFGTYGIWGSFRPDAALLKAIESGEQMCVSVVGTAHPEIVSKSAGEVVEKKRKRILRNLELTRLGVVKAGAHVGAVVTLVKGLPEPTVVERIRPRFAKAKPAATTATSGHAHVLYDIDVAEGRTSWEEMPGSQPYTGHSHPFVRNPDGSISILEAAGHAHDLATDSPETTMADDTAKSLEIAKARATTLAGLLLAAVAMPPDVAAFAKGLPADKLESFLALPEAERVAKATPIYKSERTGRAFYDETHAELAKDADAQAAELAKSREQAETVTFEKKADAEIPHLLGTAAERALILKAIDGKPLTDAEKAKAREIVKAASLTQAAIFKAPGFGGDGREPAGPQAELNQIATDLQKANPAWTFAKAKDAALETPRGRALYTEIERAKRAPATA